MEKNILFFTGLIVIPKFFIYIKSTLILRVTAEFHFLRKKVHKLFQLEIFENDEFGKSG